LVSSDGDRVQIQVGKATFGAGEPVFAAGPCTVEEPEVLVEVARGAAAAGATLLRGGAFKPTTSPYSFRGHGEVALKALREAADEADMGVVTEVLGTSQVSLVANYADMLQIGARNMQNFELLREAGRQPKPILLKRGLASTIDEWLCSAEYIAAEGNEQVVLCERGIRTFETATRATFDVASIPVLRLRSNLPVIVDPSHSSGDRRLVPHIALAAIAAGCDGLLIEVHPRPEQSLKDGRQTISTEELQKLVAAARRVAEAVNGVPLPR
jgi:3-deoxy-7-phosphoheptulonate synthase